ncbi:class I SAM-dependent methyltransferase [Mucilaginibacter lappiensis]|uniref:SAM-dependent methyltransferase n=1 Tax=Mucilaginibacter lappiensis TaxID=354630 RepID=A0A1N7CH40_9SPHI|nr:class I SAM-dependent methyltransferase [Mucilaginibacter lappiensis]MBB6110817.1 SAM-dependent methyltransferase [Mucilaginibacter lappiensis]MBB6128135.1 SAM-dependent methyltransferase [Mucilaginibacter lappiensis]SIR62895.1 Methyltransferase domain-containing protein [Mucilaginibacter lappiensis]
MDNTKRFSNRVADYVKYRPHYPTAIITFLLESYQLTIDKRIADIGAGTGISTQLFLDAGYHATAVEPNAEMRDKAIELLNSYPGFAAVDGTAENTRLASESVDAVIAGQAFHWFNAQNARAEFKRILKPGGIVALIWNERKTASAFEKEYDQLIITHGQDYVKVGHRNIDYDHIGAFYDPEPFAVRVFENQQIFNFDGLKGRLLSSSYAPTKVDAGYAAMIKDLQELFNRYQQDGVITIHYDTKVYVGRL